MNITIISPQAKTIRDKEILHQDILKILPHLCGKVSVIQAIYAEDVVDPQVSHGADLTLYLKWESPEVIPKYEINDIYKLDLIKEIPDLADIQVRIIGPTLLRAHIHYYHYIPKNKKSTKNNTTMNKYRVKITDSKSNTFEKVYHINNSGTKSMDPDFLQIEEYLINNTEFLQDIIDSDIDRLDDNLKWGINLETPLEIPEWYDLKSELGYALLSEVYLDTESLKLSIKACLDEIGFHYNPSEPMPGDLKEKFIDLLQEIL